jgi:hypothetical protein
LTYNTERKLKSKFRAAGLRKRSVPHAGRPSARDAEV